MTQETQASGGSARAASGAPGGSRWVLVVAALLLQFSIGAVYAWSVFSKALKEASAFELSSVQAALPANPARSTPIP